MAAFNFAFVDQVLPRSNARLRNLLIDIGRKKPTFELQEQVINEVPPSQYFLRANRIDAATGRLREVTIYDVGRRREPADHLRRQRAHGLRRGADRPEPAAVRRQHPPVPARGAHRVPADLLQGQRHPGEERLRRARAEHQRIGPGRPGDEHLRDARRHPGRRPGGARGVSGTAATCCVDDLRALLGAPAASPTPTPRCRCRPRPPYCGWIQSIQELVLPKTAQAQGTAQPRRPASQAPAKTQGQEARPRPRAYPPTLAPRQDSGNRRFPTGP